MLNVSFTRRAPQTIIIAALALAALATAASPQADKSARTYRCSAKDAVGLQDDGRLGKDRMAETAKKRLDGIIIDTLTGAISDADGSRQLWDVVQAGGN